MRFSSPTSCSELIYQLPSECRQGHWAGLLQPISAAFIPAPCIHCSGLTHLARGPLGAGKTAESQVLSVLLPAQRLLSAQQQLPSLQDSNGDMPSSPPCPSGLFSLSAEGRGSKHPKVYLRLAEIWKVTGTLQASLVVLGVPR